MEFLHYHCNEWGFRLDQIWLISCLSKERITHCACLARKLDHPSFCLLLCWNSSWFKGSNVLSWHDDVLAGKRTLLFMKFEYFWNIVDVVSRRIWVEAGRKIILSLIDLRDEFFERVINLALRGLFIEFGLFKTSYSFLLLVLKEHPLLFFLFINIAAEVIDLTL